MSVAWSHIQIDKEVSQCFSVIGHEGWMLVGLIAGGEIEWNLDGFLCLPLETESESELAECELSIDG